MSKSLPFVLVFFYLASSNNAISQSSENLLELSLEQLLNVKVYAATKTETQIEEAPASITVINQQDIARFGYRNVAEVLSRIAGFSSTNNLVYQDFGVRGSHAGTRAGSRIIKVLVNGKPIAFRSSGQNFIGDSLFSTAIIDRVEVIRGPASTLYGANAFLGVVNIVTSQAENLEYMRAAVSYQHFDRAENGYGLNLSMQSSSDNYQLLADVSLDKKDRSGLWLPMISPESDSYYQLDSNRHSRSLTDESEPNNAFINWRYEFSTDSNLELQAMRQEVNSDYAFADLNPLRDSGYSRINLVNQHVSLNHEYKLNKDHQLRSQFIWSKGLTGDDDKIELGAQDHYLTRRNGFNALDLQMELVSQWHHQGQTLIGLDHSDEDYEIETFYRVERDTGELTSLMPPENETIDNTGIYLQWQKRMYDDFELTLGYRHDHGTISGSQDSYRIGLVWLYQQDLTFKLLWGDAFQAPTAELLYREAAQAGDIIGNENLASQRAQTLELVMNWQPAPSWYLSLTGFYTEVEDLVVYQTDFTNLFAENSSASESYGAELELKFEWDKLTGYGNYSYHKMDMEPPEKSLFILERNNDGEILPRHVLNLGLSYELNDGHTLLSFEHQYNSKRPASLQNVLIAQQFYELSPYHHSDIFLRQALPEFIEQGSAYLEFKIRNLFDNRYVLPGFGGIDYPNLGRRYELTLEWLF